MQMAQHLLADQLGGDEAQLLVGDLLLREVARAGGQMLDDGLQQAVAILAVQGRDEQPRLEIPQRPVCLDVRRRLARRQQVGLVQGQDDRRLAGSRPQDLGDLAVLVVGRLRAIDQEQHQVGVGDGAHGGLDHVLAQLVQRLVNARRIDKDRPGHRPGSTRASSRSRVRMPSSWLRVVCGLGETMAIFWPR